MDSETQKIIADQMKILPADVKAAIVSVDYQAKLREIILRQKLLIDQAGKLEMETTLVMIGLEPLSDYVTNLERELGVNGVRAREIALDVSENIFKPIRESLQQMDERSRKSEVAEEPAGDEGLNEAEPEPTKFTNTNETNLNRDQILSEIENPIPNHPDAVIQPAYKQPMTAKPETVKTAGTELEIRPEQALETVPGQQVKEVISKPADIFASKMTGVTVTTKQVIDVKPETKLPEINKRKSYGETDPYREPIE